MRRMASLHPRDPVISLVNLRIFVVVDVGGAEGASEVHEAFLLLSFFEIVINHFEAVLTELSLISFDLICIKWVVLIVHAMDCR